MTQRGGVVAMPTVMPSDCRSQTIVAHQEESVNLVGDGAPKVVYWHRELPPLDAELIAQHSVEAE